MDFLTELGIPRTTLPEKNILTVLYKIYIKFVEQIFIKNGTHILVMQAACRCLWEFHNRLIIW